MTIRRALDGRPGKSLIPVGIRGVGKTVLLNRFAEIAEGEGYAVAFLEAPETGGFPTLLAVRLRKVLLGLQHARMSRAVTRALGVLKSFTLQLPDGSSIQLDPEPLLGEADSGQLAEDLTDVLVAAGRAARDRQRAILLVIDEIQYLSRDQLGALIVAVHRTIQLDLPVVLVGAGLPQLPGLAGEAKSYAERLFEFPEIRTFTDDDARAVVAIPAGREGVELVDEALDEIVTRSQGYPYFLQEWGYRVWNQAPGSPITLGDVLAAAPAVQAGLDRDFFRVRFDRLTPRERAYALAMAELGPGPHRSGDIATRMGARVEAVAPRRAALIRKGMVYSPAHGLTAFTVPLFDEFLLRTAGPAEGDA